MTHRPRRLPGNRAAADLLEDHQVPGAREQPARAWPSSPARCFDRAMLEMGPTQLNIPRDYFYGEIECEIPQPIAHRARRRAASRASTRRPSCSRRRKFPVIVAGGGVVMGDAARRSAWRSPSTCRRPVVQQLPAQRLVPGEPSAVVRPARLPGLEGGDEADRRRPTWCSRSARASVRSARCRSTASTTGRRTRRSSRSTPTTTMLGPGQADHRSASAATRKAAAARAARRASTARQLACHGNRERALADDQGREGRVGDGARRAGRTRRDPWSRRSRRSESAQRCTRAQMLRELEKAMPRRCDGVHRHRQHLLGVQQLPALRAAALDVRGDELRQLRLRVPDHHRRQGRGAGPSGHRLRRRRRVGHELRRDA